MKPLKIFIFLSVYMNAAVIANPQFVTSVNPVFDLEGNWIAPDKIFLKRALQHYKDGFNQSALTNFKKAATFGNSIAQKYMGLMYIKALGVKQDWAQGYAWIKIAALSQQQDQLELRNKLAKILNPKEKKQAEKIYAALLKEYSPHECLLRRNRWLQKLKHHSFVVGSRTGSLALSGRVLSYNNLRDLQTNTPTRVSKSETLENMNHFVFNYNFGIVTQSEITSKEDEKKKNSCYSPLSSSQMRENTSGMYFTQPIHGFRPSG